MKTRSAGIARIVLGGALTLAASGLVQAGPAEDSYVAIDSVSPAPSFVGEEVTVEYTVWGYLFGPMPTGDVTVTDGTDSCTGTVAEGSCTITFDSQGAKTLKATYWGNDDYNGSISPPETHSVLDPDEPGLLLCQRNRQRFVVREAQENLAIMPVSRSPGLPIV